MDTKTIFLAVAVYFLISELYKKVRKNKKYIDFPDNDMNILFRRIDKVNNISAYAAIALGFSILTVILCFYLKELGYMTSVSYLKLNWRLVYSLSLSSLIIGMIMNVLFLDGTTKFLGSLNSIKDSIINYYEIQKFRKRGLWIDYPENISYKKNIIY